jgi:hypothetical protein
MKRTTSRCGISFVDSDVGAPLSIRTELLAPGDVLVTGGLGKGAKAIRSMTRGPFSHAAIVLSSTALFESRTDGIFFTELPIRRIEVPEEGPWAVLAGLPWDASRAAVLRNAQVAALPSETMTTAMETVTERHLGSEYPDIATLVRLWLPFARWIPDWLLYMLDKSLHKRRALIAGPYCSALVLEFYNLLGISLNLTHTKDGRLSPNDLAMSSSFTSITDLIVEDDSKAVLQERLVGELRQIPTVDRAASLPILLNSKRTIKRMQELTSETDRLLQSLLVRHRKKDGA